MIAYTLERRKKMLFDCLKKGTAPNRVVSYAKEYLMQNGFEELYYDKIFHPIHGGKYFVAPFPDVLFAFTVGEKI